MIKKKIKLDIFTNHTLEVLIVKEKDYDKLSKKYNYESKYNDNIGWFFVIDYDIIVLKIINYLIVY